MDDIRKKIEELRRAANQVYVDKTNEILREQKMQLIQQRMQEERARKDPRDIIFEKINQLAKKGEWEEILQIYQQEKPGFIKEHALKSISTAANNILEQLKNNLQLDKLVRIEISQFINEEVKKNCINIINQIYDKSLNNYKNSKKTEQIEQTKREYIREAARVKLAEIEAKREVFITFLEKSFDERKELIKEYFERLDIAINEGDIQKMSLILYNITDLSKSSPFKALADIENALNNKDEVIEL